MKKITIAIDGFSSCGKSTMAKDLAKRIGYIYVDTGAMYRCVTLFAMLHGMIGKKGDIKEKALMKSIEKGEVSIAFRLNKSGTPDAYLCGENVERRIRTMEVSANVSQVAALPFVREALVGLQKRMGKDKGVVMDGRDIGTTVFPDAELKVFLTASVEVRAKRRYDELISKGIKTDMEEVVKNINERDYIDSHRETSPLRKAEDAIELDNSQMTISQQSDWIYERFLEISLSDSDNSPNSFDQITEMSGKNHREEFSSSSGNPGNESPDKSDSIVIIPTYNEKENIENIIRAIGGLAKCFHILIVDDGSPDGTAGIVKNLMKGDFSGRLFLLERKGKQGLGTAYISGFKWALSKDYQYIFEMDADFSHDPNDLPRLYAACHDEGNDVAIGSRYITGVNVVNWPMSRVLMSYFASKYVRMVTGLNIHDTTAGFKCYRRRVLETIELDKIRFKGYAFQIEMKFTAYKIGFRIKEVSVIFVNRREGVSKMSGGIFSEALFGVIRLRLDGWTRKYPPMP